MNMKIIKIAVLVVSLGFGLNAAAAKLGCVTLIDKDGKSQKQCFYATNPANAWSFITAISTLYRGETSTGIDYNSLYDEIEWTIVNTCFDAQIEASRQSGVFLPGHGCVSENILLEQAYQEAEAELVEWFWNGNGCGYAVDAMVALTGVGATRAVLKVSIKRLYKKAKEGATTKQIVETAETYAMRANAAGAISGFVGIVLGETINDAVCSKVESWVRDNG